MKTIAVLTNFSTEAKIAFWKGFLIIATHKEWQHTCTRHYWSIQTLSGKFPILKIDPMSAIVAVIEFKGDSKKIYPFNVYPLNEECPQESGVYIFTKRSLNSSTFKFEHNVCFIGSAETIPNKLYDQQKKHCIDLNATNSVCYLAVPVEADRKAIERDLLKACNTLSSEVKNANFLSKPDALPY